jgi:hypothetical protein
MPRTFSATSVIASLLFAASPAHADTINVPGDQPTIQAGIDAAVNGDDVVVAPGTYAENINLNGKAITLRSTDPADLLVVYATIINGGGVDTTIRCISGETSATVIDGLLITNPLPNSLSQGGGMRIISSSPTVRRCVFFQSTAGAGHGGGVYSASASPSFEDCTFLECEAAGNGGAMWNMQSTPSVHDGVFRNNQAGFGGAVFSQISPVTYTDCQFDDNAATALKVGNGGALYHIENSPGTFVDCAFRRNDAVDAGGAVFSVGGSPTTISGSFFCQNDPSDISGNFTDLGGNQFLIACPPPGACCLGSACIQATQDECEAAGGAYQGDGTLCAAAACPAACPADIVSSATFAPPPDGNVDAADLAYLLGSWGACE